MKKVAQFTSQVQGHIISQTLLNSGIKSELIGARDYSSIIVGGDMGKYDLFVDWKDEAEALRILKEIDSKTIPVGEQTPPSAGSLFKKSIIHAILACVFIPILFNYTSLKTWWQYWNTETNLSRKLLATVVIFALQLPTFVFSIYIFKEFNSYIGLF